MTSPRPAPGDWFRRAGPATAAGSFAILALTGTPATAGPSFDAWIQRVYAEALGRGISRATLDKALTGIKPIAKVIEKDKTQPKYTMKFRRYQRLIVSKKRIELGRRHFAANRGLLDTVSREYGVPGRFIVALWGVETFYGEITGTYPVIAAVGTLAHAGRRRRLFRRQLFAALKIVDRGDITLDRLKGSWAGAMGQIQFIPSSYLAFAVDRDGDGRRDIWSSKADIFASAANYLARNGWRRGETWGRAVRLPRRLKRRRGGRARPFSAWRAAGVRAADGGPLPRATIRATLLRPAGTGGPAFLVYRNYRVLLRWNNSAYFAVAVGRLADAIGR